MFDVEAVRRGFPALSRTVGDRPVAYLDGPGGTQVPATVIEAMTGPMRRGASNVHGRFAASIDSEQTVAAARQAMADLLGCRPDEVVFGPNMTTLTFAMSRAMGRTWTSGDNIVLTRLDHDANVSPWMLAARDAGVEVRFVGFDLETTQLDLAELSATVDDRTRLIAVTHASNALGTVVDVATVTEIGHRVGAVVFVDAVHAAPHRRIDVAGIGCDLLAVSPYKFFGPHAGCLFGRAELLAELPAYKVRPAPDEPPERWETGTASFEAMAGVAAAVDHLASLGAGGDRRSRLDDAFVRTARHEERLAARFLEGIASIDGVTCHGVPEPDMAVRTPTFAVEVAGVAPGRVAEVLGAEGIFVWAGDYYAVEVMRRLGKADDGLVRIGFVNYSTLGEVDRVVSALARIAGDAD